MMLGKFFRRGHVSAQPDDSAMDEWHVPQRSGVSYLELDKQPTSSQGRRRVARGTLGEKQLLDAIDNVDWLLASLRGPEDCNVVATAPERLPDGTDAFVRVSSDDVSPLLDDDIEIIEDDSALV